MAIEYSGVVGYSNYADLDAIASPEIAVAAGNLVVVITDAANTAHSDTLVVTDTAGNTYTDRPQVQTAAGTWQMSYTFATAGNATNIVTATWDESTSIRHSITVWVFTKDAGETWAFDAGNSDSGYSASWASDVITLAGAGELCIGGGCMASAPNLSDIKIATEAATASHTPTAGTCTTWYLIGPTDTTDIEATATDDGDAWWISELIAFKVMAGGEQSVVPLIMLQYDHFGGGIG